MEEACDSETSEHATTIRYRSSNEDHRLTEICVSVLHWSALSLCRSGMCILCFQICEFAWLELPYQQLKNGFSTRLTCADRSAQTALLHKADLNSSYFDVICTFWLAHFVVWLKTRVDSFRMWRRTRCLFCCSATNHNWTYSKFVVRWMQSHLSPPAPPLCSVSHVLGGPAEAPSSHIAVLEPLYARQHFLYVITYFRVIITERKE